MKRSILSGKRKIAVALAASVIALAGTPVFAGPKQLGPSVAAGQSRYLIEYNAGNKQAVYNAISQYGGRVVYDYSALFNGIAADLSDNGVKSLRTSGLVKTIEGDVVRTLHREPVRHEEGDEAFLSRRAAKQVQSAGVAAVQQTGASVVKSTTAAASAPKSATQTASASSPSGAATAEESQFEDGGVPQAVPAALPAGFPGPAAFSEFVGWDRDRAQADVVWSTGPNFGPADNNIAAPDVAAGSVTGAGVVVGVLDTGVDYNHPDFWTGVVGASTTNIVNDCGSGVVRDFLTLDDCPADDTFNGHGTSVSSVIASLDDGEGLIGVAPGAMIRPYRVCDGSCPLSAIIGGLVQATVDGVDVINMSFGGGAGKNFEASAIQAAAAAGIVLVASAGNDASQKIHFPSGYGQVLAVGATDINDNAASFTNYGGWVDLVGPGVNNPTATCSGCVTEGVVDETSPDRPSFQANEMTNSPIIAVTGQEVVDVGRACSSLGDTLTTNPSGKVALIVRGGCSFAEKVAFAESAGAIATIVRNNAAGNFFGTLGAYFPTGPSVSISQADGATLAGDIAGGTTTADVGIIRRYDIGYWLISGTSFSGPTVAGVAALVLDANPNLTADEVRHLLVNTAESFGNQNLFGAGMVRADNAVTAAQP